MLSFKSPSLFRLTERLSFKKLKEVEDDEDFASFDLMYSTSSQASEDAWQTRIPAPSPVLSFSEYNGGAKLTRKNRRHPSAEQEQYHYHYSEYRPDGTVNTRSIEINGQDRSSNNRKRRLSILVALDGTIDKLKYTLHSTDNKYERKQKKRFTYGSKVNADVKIQFDGEKFVYRI